MLVVVCNLRDADIRPDMRENMSEVESNSSSTPNPAPSSSNYHEHRPRSWSVDSADGDLPVEHEHMREKLRQQGILRNAGSATATRSSIRSALADQIYGKFDRNARIRLIDVIMVPLYSRVWQLGRLGEVLIPYMHETSAPTISHSGAGVSLCIILYRWRSMLYCLTIWTAFLFVLLHRNRPFYVSIFNDTSGSQ